MKNNTTPLILTYNEAPNIERTLQKLTWAKEVVIIDSFSSDNTIELVKKFPNTRILQRKFDDHTSQWNFGLSQISTQWVLSLDADYLLTEDLQSEIISLQKNSDVNGYFISFKYCVLGKPLKSTILPPRLALFKKEFAKYVNDGHTQMLELDGKPGMLKNAIHHDDRKPLSRWVWAQEKYMEIESEKLLNTPAKDLSMADKIRKLIIFSPFIVLVYCLIVKRGIFDGWRGWLYAFQRCFAELLLSLHLLEQKLLKSKNNHPFAG